ncbi:MAG TPA: hydroxymethylbilane synthase [Verrucomicrobiales bacterium]|nr:hydroxymethylbilane synthase [Verrucomicrobiales bacterium]
MTELILGTRGSELALTQTEMTQAALAVAWPELRVRHEIIKTSGDLRPDLKLADFSKGDQPVVDKGIFTKELEQALKAGTIHAAVHSLKDVPTILEEGYRIAAVLPRAPVQDVLISKIAGGLEALPAGSVVATSSVRRARLLKWLRPNLTVAEIRGNVATRIRKVADDPSATALLLARAGLERLGLFEDRLTDFGPAMHLTVLDAAQFLPAASQGAVAIETFGENAELQTILAAINHPDTFSAITAERRFLELLQAGCQTPVGVHTSLDAGGNLHMKALVFPDAGGDPARGEAAGPVSDPRAVAAALFKSLTKIP